MFFLHVSRILSYQLSCHPRDEYMYDPHGFLIPKLRRNLIFAFVDLLLSFDLSSYFNTVSLVLFLFSRNSLLSSQSSLR